MASANKTQSINVNKELQTRAQKIKYGLLHTYNAKPYKESLLMFIMDIR